MNTVTRTCSVRCEWTIWYIGRPAQSHNRASTSTKPVRGVTGSSKRCEVFDKANGYLCVTRRWNGLPFWVNVEPDEKRAQELLLSQINQPSTRHIPITRDRRTHRIGVTLERCYYPKMRPCSYLPPLQPVMVLVCDHYRHLNRRLSKETVSDPSS